MYNIKLKKQNKQKELNKRKKMIMQNIELISEKNDGN